MQLRVYRVPLLLAALVLAGESFAQGRKPAPKEKKESHPVKEAKDSANKALNDLDKGVHEAAREVKKGANEALQAVDDTIHGRKTH